MADHQAPDPHSALQETAATPAAAESAQKNPEDLHKAVPETVPLSKRPATWGSEPAAPFGNPDFGTSPDPQSVVQAVAASQAAVDEPASMTTGDEDIQEPVEDGIAGARSGLGPQFQPLLDSSPSEQEVEQPAILTSHSLQSMSHPVVSSLEAIPESKPAILSPAPIEVLEEGESGVPKSLPEAAVVPAMDVSTSKTEPPVKNSVAEPILETAPAEGVGVLPPQIEKGAIPAAENPLLEILTTKLDTKPEDAVSHPASVEQAVVEGPTASSAATQGSHPGSDPIPQLSSGIASAIEPQNTSLPPLTAETPGLPSQITHEAPQTTAGVSEGLIPGSSTSKETLEPQDVPRSSVEPPSGSPQPHFPAVAAAEQADLAAAHVSAQESNPPATGVHDDWGMIIDLQVDPRRGTRTEADSALGSDAASTSTSITSSVTDYRFEHGRRYHAFGDGQYHLPNDEQEMDRLELQHRIWSAMFNKRLFLAPLPARPEQVLDVGCGTGAWAIEFADAFPDTQVIGTDLSPIQPHSVPPNVSFLVDDATQEWAFGPGRFDYVHTRAITMGIRDWDAFVRQAWEALKPGGWVELQEFHLPVQCDDGTMGEDSALFKWGKDVSAALARVGIDHLASLQHPERMRKQGFVNVSEQPLKIPLGVWAKGEAEKKIGSMAQKDLEEGLEAISMKLLILMGYEEEECKRFLDDVRLDVKNNKIHKYMPIDVCWAQKPFDA